MVARVCWSIRNLLEYAGMPLLSIGKAEAKSMKGAMRDCLLVDTRFVVVELIQSNLLVPLTSKTLLIKDSFGASALCSRYNLFLGQSTDNVTVAEGSPNTQNQNVTHSG